MEEKQKYRVENTPGQGAEGKGEPTAPLKEQVARANHWMATRFPGAVPHAVRGFFALRSSGTVRITNDWVMAYTVGGWGSPEAPIVYCRTARACYEYDVREAIYRELDDEEVVQRVVDIIETCARETGAHGILDVLLTKAITAVVSVLKGLQGRQPAGLGSPSENHRPGSLQVANGLLDIRTLTLSPAAAANAGVWRLPISWDPSAPSPRRFWQFMGDLVPDEDDRELLLDLLASAFVGNPGQKLLILRGDGGAGKSSLIDLLKLLMGTGAVGNLALKHVNRPFTAITWRDRLVLVEGEADQGNFDRSQSVLKRISGQDSIFGDRKNRDPVDFVSHALPILVSNSTLVIRSQGDESAWLRRAVILDIPMAPAGRPVVYGIARVLVEEEGPGILRALATRASRIWSGERPIRALTPAQTRRITALFSCEAFLSRWAAHALRPAQGAPPLYRDIAWKSYQSWAREHGYPEGPAVPPTGSLRRAVEGRGGRWSQSLPEPKDRSVVHACKGWRGVELST